MKLFYWFVVLINIVWGGLMLYCALAGFGPSYFLLASLNLGTSAYLLIGRKPWAE